MIPPGRKDAVHQARRVLLVGILINLVLAGVKIVIGAVAKSQALIADGVHSFSDLITDLVVWLGIKMGRAEADENHPYGHGRIETLASMIVGVALGVTAAGIVWYAVEGLVAGGVAQPGWAAAAAALVSLVAKEWLFVYTIRVGRRVSSPALVANAWHHRTDSLSSLAVLVGVIAGVIDPEWAFLDRVAALAVAALILKAAWDIGRQAILEMIDTAPPEDLVAEVAELTGRVPGVIGVKECRVRRSGSRLLVSCDIEVDPNLTIREAHTVADVVEAMVRAGEPSVARVIVHVEPAGD